MVKLRKEFASNMRVRIVTASILAFLVLLALDFLERFLLQTFYFTGFFMALLDQLSVTQYILLANIVLVSALFINIYLVYRAYKWFRFNKKQLITAVTITLLILTVYLIAKFIPGYIQWVNCSPPEFCVEKGINKFFIYRTLWQLVSLSLIFISAGIWTSTMETLEGIKDQKQRLKISSPIPILFVVTYLATYILPIFIGQLLFKPPEGNIQQLENIPVKYEAEINSQLQSIDQNLETVTLDDQNQTINIDISNNNKSGESLSVNEIDSNDRTIKVNISNETETNNSPFVNEDEVRCGQLIPNSTYTHYLFLVAEKKNSNLNATTDNVCDPFKTNLSLWVGENATNRTKLIVDGNQKVTSAGWKNENEVIYWRIDNQGKEEMVIISIN